MVVVVSALQIESLLLVPSDDLLDREIASAVEFGDTFDRDVESAVGAELDGAFDKGIEPAGGDSLRTDMDLLEIVVRVVGGRLVVGDTLGVGFAVGYRQLWSESGWAHKLGSCSSSSLDLRRFLLLY